jgi:K+-sensing histidine kinase KdpD
MRWLMKKILKSITPDLYIHCVFAVATVVATTVPLKLIGRDTLGEAVIALLYLVPVGWSTTRWGQAAGICSALAAALTFDYFFIPPFNTFSVGNLEGWLVLIIFLAVAIVVVGRIQSGLSRAQASEREAIFMYEMSVSLAGLRTQEAVTRALAIHLQQMFQTAHVEIFIQQGNQSPPIIVKIPADGVVNSKPDRVLPILASPGLVGEIHLWRGNGWLPAEDSRLIKNITSQAGLALERARLAEIEMNAMAVGNGSLK